MDTGERMILWCEGGPAVGRTVRYVPLLEIEVGAGVYVLGDDGPPEHWRYEFVAAAH